MIEVELGVIRASGAHARSISTAPTDADAANGAQLAVKGNQTLHKAASPMLRPMPTARPIVSQRSRRPIRRLLRRRG